MILYLMVETMCKRKTTAAEDLQARRRSLSLQTGGGGVVDSGVARVCDVLRLIYSVLRTKPLPCGGR